MTRKRYTESTTNKKSMTNEWDHAVSAPAPTVAAAAGGRHGVQEWTVAWRHGY